MSAADKDPPGWPAFALCTAVTIPLRTSLAIFCNSRVCMILSLSLTDLYNSIVPQTKDFSRDKMPANGSFTSVTAGPA